MFVTSVLCKKVKSKFLLVLLESVASGHKYVVRRARIDEKIEVERFDPFVNARALYREVKKIKSI